MVHPLNPSPLTHPDVLLNVFRHADKATLATCMRVSWCFFETCGPLLYYDLSIKLDQAGEVFRGIGAAPLKEIPDDRRRISKRNLLDRVRTLRIDWEHDCFGFLGDGSCRQWREKDLKLPSLEVLDVNFSNHWNPSACSWVSTLTPNKLLVTNVPESSPRRPLELISVVLEMADGMFSIPVEKLVLKLNRWACPPGRHSWYLPYCNFPPCRSAEAVIILWTRTPDERWEREPSYEESLQTVVGLLTICAAAMPGRLTICNLDRFVSFCPEVDSLEDYVRHATPLAVDELWSDSCMQYEASRAADQISAFRFITLEEYLATEGWNGEFSEAELAPWNDAIEHEREARRGRADRVVG
ncbi:hypothetical protein IAU60_006583 [Kwoniella sp. DSM 27419]